MEKHSSEKIQDYINTFKHSKVRWIAELWRLVEKHFNNYYQKIESSKLPISLDYNIFLFSIFFNIMKIINFAMVNQNPYSQISPPLGNNLFANPQKIRRKVKLNKVMVEDLIKDMLFSGNFLFDKHDLTLMMENILKEANQGKKFSGKKRKKEDEDILKNMLKIRNELFNIDRSSHHSGYKQSVRIYFSQKSERKSDRQITTWAQKLSNFEKSLHKK